MTSVSTKQAKNAVHRMALAIRHGVLALALVLTAVGGAVVGAASTATVAEAAVVRSISVRGNQRVDADTIRSYVTVKPGRNFTSFDTDESLQALFATGLFADVRIAQQGRVLVVEVRENPIINLVRFEGNDKVRDEQLVRIVQSQSLGIFSQEKLDSDLERVREAVRRSGRASATVNGRVDQLDNNRVDIIFQINEGGRTKIADINFVGNNAFGDRRLTEVISHNESNFLSWLKRDDVFDPDRLRADEERLRQFYFNRGYADFRVISAVGDFDAAANSYTITITVDEGELYSFGNINIDNALTAVDAEALKGELEIAPGDRYSARKVERTLVAMTEAIARSGYAFAEVTPRGDRNLDDRTIDITFFVDEGPRTYIERIEVVGNTRTRGYVIRREFDVSEGDAYNRVLVNKAKRRLDRLGFFTSVRITTRPGSAPDRVVVVVNVKDKPTGEFAVGGGYSSSNGPIAEISLQETNFLGRGQFLKISGGFGDETTKYQLSFTEPYFLGRRVAVGFDLQSEEAEVENLYDSEVYLGRIRAAAPLTDNLTLGANYTFKQETDTQVENATVSFALADTLARSPYTTSSVGYSLTYNTIDNLKNPREGIFAKFEQDFAGVGGDAQYISTRFKASTYYLLSEDADIVLLGAVGAGHIEGLGDDTLRVTDHFFQGGETIRGFERRGLGPRTTTGEEVGGQTYWNATAEVQFPIGLLPRSYGIRGALFADAGTLYDSAYSSDPQSNIIDTDDIRTSVGASILWDSPFGPLRADFSHVLNKADQDETQFFRFGVSTRF
ncbi:MAG: outer membrane protein assembly factor BamA [Pseudomonadota bacterium]